ncbi:chorismate lyase [Aliiglaciecola sp.]|nr:chorismate lyase [Aliiglaciecola sp.]
MTHLIRFPVSIPSDWQSSKALTVADPYLRNWLLDTGSLTERLQSHCMNFELTVIGQRPMQPELEEISQFSQSNHKQSEQQWQIREVLLSGNGLPWVFARSILPQALCDMEFAELGSRPLGQIIFNDERFVRRPFQLLTIPPKHTFQQQLAVDLDMSLWGRRSVFNFNHLQLMVAEVFLPDCPAYRQLER